VGDSFRRVPSLIQAVKPTNPKMESFLKISIRIKKTKTEVDFCETR
jgi:hypothetical protein